MDIIVVANAMVRLVIVAVVVMVVARLTVVVFGECGLVVVVVARPCPMHPCSPVPLLSPRGHGHSRAGQRQQH